MKRNWKLIDYSILSSRPIISNKFTNKPFQKGNHINNTFLKGGFKCQGKKSQLQNLSYHLWLKWYQIQYKFPIIFHIICIFLSTLWFLDCKRNFSITFWFDYRIQYTLTFTVSGTNLELLQIFLKYWVLLTLIFWISIHIYLQKDIIHQHGDPWLCSFFWK